MFFRIISYRKLFFTFIFAVISTFTVNAQTFGFGCLGLSGFYAGYTNQQYGVEGLNEFINAKYLSNQSTINFNEGTGYRIGANLFRAKFKGLFISAKGYYQFLRESHEMTENSFSNVAKDKYTLTMDHWGVALDFGIPLFSIIDFKLIEGGVHFYNTEFVHQYYLNNNLQTETKYKPEKTKLSYYVGSGLILHLIPDYVSIEGTAAYTFVKYEKLVADNGSTIPTSINGKIPFDKGGFSTTLQLNIGFPL